MNSTPGRMGRFGPVAVAARLLSFIRDPHCCLSRTQIEADAELNLALWRDVEGEPLDPVERERIALAEAIAAADAGGNSGRAREYREMRQALGPSQPSTIIATPEEGSPDA